MPDMRKFIYLDQASTTPVHPTVLKAMQPFWSTSFGNPGSLHFLGGQAKKALAEARKKVAENINTVDREIIFTSGGTEANNLAIFGLVNQLVSQARHSSLEKGESKRLTDLHFITTEIEHSSVLECFKELESRGGKVDYLKVNEKGLVNPKDLRKLIKKNTVLVSVIYANNEIGTVQPIKEIAKEVRHARAVYQGLTLIFHTDASQATNSLNLNVQELGVDLMTIDAQKMSGPKGVGALFVKSGVNLSPIIFGGGQEGGLKAGTENVPLIVGLATALSLVRTDYEKKAKKIKFLRDYFWKKIEQAIPGVILNGDLEHRLVNNLNISIPDIDAEFMVLCLAEAGIICSTKSTCAQDEAESRSVRSLGGPTWRAKNSLRFSLNEDLSKADLDYVVKTLKQLIIQNKI